MNLVFAGTPEFARAFLEAILQLQDHQVTAVYTQPDRRAGRGKQLRASPVKELALAHHLALCQPHSLRTPEAQQEFADLAPDLLIVVAYGLILPQQILQIPTFGCINVHASLLPRWRGAAPIQRTIAAGDPVSGISIMRMDAGLDTGDILAEAQLELAGNETSGSLHDRLIELGKPLLLEVLEAMPDILDQARPQDEALASYAEKISTTEAQIDWRQPAAKLDAWVRALNPTPGAYTLVQGERMKIWQAQVAHGAGAPGTILTASADGLEVACGKGSLLIRRAQLPGKSAMDVADLVRGYAQLFEPGAVAG